MAREAYEHLADNVTMRVDEPREASQLAAGAFQEALARHRRGHRRDRGACAPVRGRPAAA